MNEKFKKILSFGAFLVALTIGFVCYSNEKTYISVNAKPIFEQKIIIDAGHGGFDGGAVAMDGTSEKDINLKIAKKLKNFLLVNGYDVIMTRESDTATNDYGTKIRSKKVSDMQNRLYLMEENKDALFVSIHLNKFTTSAASGAQIFYSDNFKESSALATSIKESIVSLIEPQNKRTIKKGTSSAYLLYNAKVPAVIVECGFLSNNRDLCNLKDEDFQSKMAFAIANGILNFNGSEK